MQVRLRMPVGTRIERTEDATKKLLQYFEDVAGKGNIIISSSFVGLQPPTYAINSIFLYTSGPHEALLKVKLAKSVPVDEDELKEKIRGMVSKNIQGASLSFEPADLVDQVMSLGSDNPVEVVVQGKDIQQSRQLAANLMESLKGIDYLRDVQVPQPLDYPTIQINYDRVRAGQMGITVDQAGRSVTEGTSSSRFITPVYWLDKTAGTSYQVQIEYPQMGMNSTEQVEQIPVGNHNNNPVYLRDIADYKNSSSIGEYNRINQQRFITVTANIHKQHLSKAVTEINKAISKLGKLPQGVKVYMRGQSDLLTQTINELSLGLLLAIVVIGLMLTAYFQSFKLTLSVLTVFPGVLAGSILFIWLTGNSINIQSFMGCIMAVGVAVANAILLVHNAEQLRVTNNVNGSIGATAARNRLRPILMTSFAMIAGMIPMALGIGESGKQTAPLAIAVIGGLFFSTFISLWLVPLVYDLQVTARKSKQASLDPNDINSPFYDSIR
jgi:multidrug efflux pump subunit AcrB